MRYIECKPENSMKVIELIHNYDEKYHIMIFPKGRVNKPVKHIKRYLENEVEDYTEYEFLKVVMIYVK